MWSAKKTECVAAGVGKGTYTNHKPWKRFKTLYALFSQESFCFVICNLNLHTQQNEWRHGERARNYIGNQLGWDRRFRWLAKRTWKAQRSQREKGTCSLLLFEGSNSIGRQDRTHEYSCEQTNDFTFVCVLLCSPNAVRGFCMCVRAFVFP